MKNFPVFSVLRLLNQKNLRLLDPVGNSLLMGCIENINMISDNAASFIFYGVHDIMITFVLMGSKVKSADTV